MFSTPFPDSPVTRPVLEEITALRNALTASEKKAEEGQAAQAAKTTEECVGSFLAQVLLLLYFLCVQGDHDIAEFPQCFGEEAGGKPGSAGHQNDRGGERGVGGVVGWRW